MKPSSTARGNEFGLHLPPSFDIRYELSNMKIPMSLYEVLKSPLHRKGALRAS